MVLLVEVPAGAGSGSDNKEFTVTIVAFVVTEPGEAELGYVETLVDQELIKFEVTTSTPPVAVR